MFGLSVETVNDWANRIYLFAGAGVILFTGVALLASFFMWRSSVEISQKNDRELAQYQTDASVQIEDARARAAGADERAEQSRLETERVKATVAWRTLSQAQVAKLFRSLRENPGPVNLRYTDGDPEALYFADQIARVLTEAGWTVATGSLKLGHTILFDLWIPDGGNLAETFRSAGLHVTIQTPPNQGMTAQFNVQTIQNAPTLIVGSRNPPAFE